MLAKQRILVVGSGISGLSFVLALLKQCEADGVAPPSVTIVEQHAEPVNDESNERANYSIGIRGDIGGVQALESLGVLAEAQRLACDDRGFFVGSVWRDGQWHQDVMLERSERRPETRGLRISRVKLRALLLRSLPSHVQVRWRTRLTGVALVRDDTTSPATVHVSAQLSRSDDHDDSDGTTSEEAFELVVAADGCRSTARSLVFGEQPQYALRFTNSAGIAGCAHFADANDVPAIARTCHGVLFGTKGRSLFLAHESPTRVMWALSYPTEQPRPRDVDSDQAREALLQEARVCGAEQPALMAQLLDATPASSMRSISMFDKMPHASALDNRLVFIGDSTHPVSPYGGSGANMALVDGVHLGSAVAQLGRQHATIEAAVKAFDAEMVPRAERICSQQRMMLTLSHTTKWWQLRARSMMLTCLAYPRTALTAASGLALATVVGLAAGAYYLYNNADSLTFGGSAPEPTL